jgi:hypothetical protein
MSEVIALSDEQRVARGHRAAKELKETEEVFAELERELFGQWKSTKPENVEQKERLHMAVWMLEAVKAGLKARVQDGELVSTAIAQMNLRR